MFQKFANWLNRATAGRRFYCALILLALIGLIIRLIVCHQMYGLPSVQSPAVVTDMATYRRMALEIRQGNWPEFFDYQPLYYTVFLPVVWLFSPSGAAWLPMLAQSLLAAVTIILTGLAAARCYGRRAGVAAALLLTLARFHIFYTPFLLIEVLQSFWLSLLIFLGLIAWRRNRWFDWGALALTAAAATLTRGNILLFLPGILLFAIIRNRRQILRGAAYVLLIIVLFQALQFPFAWRNYRATGKWAGPSVAGNKVLVLGNSPEAPDGGLEYPRIYHYWEELDNIPDETRRVPALASILQWAKHEPVVFAELTFRKILLYWSYLEIANNVSIDVEGQASSLLKSPILLSSGLLYALALTGIILNLRRRRPCDFWLTHAVLAFCLSTAAFYILARFRIAGLPGIAIAGGGALRELLLALARPKIKIPGQANMRNRLGQAFLALFFAILIAGPAYPNYRHGLHGTIMQYCRPNGLHLALPGQTVIYDHGPLNFGGNASLMVSGDQLVLKKYFTVTEPRNGKQASLLIQVAGGEFLKATVVNGGQRLPEPQIIRDRMVTWLQYTIPALSVQDNTAEFLIKLEGTAGHTSAIFCDTALDYHRTLQKLPDGEWAPIGAELTAELVIF